MSHRVFALSLLSVVAFACAPGDAEPPPPAEPEIGPVDGHDLPPQDLDRVQVGDLAPDFVLPAFAGGVRQLSQYRGEKNVVLVFYRGHW